MNEMAAQKIYFFQFVTATYNHTDCLMELQYKNQKRQKGLSEGDLRDKVHRPNLI